jgi:hypothetical protein
MSWVWRTLFLLGLLIAAGFSQSPSNAETIRLAREYISGIYQGQVSALWRDMTPEMQQAMKSETDLLKLASTLKFQLGDETSMDKDKECVMPAPHAQVYTRLAHFSAVPGAIIVMLSLDEQGKVAGLYFRPQPNPAPSRYLDYKDQAAYFLPFRGQWLIYQGGRSTYDNYHAEAPDERFAYDIVDVEGGKLYSGSGDKLQDYFGFGKPVLAPADGKVVSAVDEYDDNPIMQPSTTSPKQGNSIVIKSANGEFSMLAHLERGSIRVRRGQKVKAGQQVALSGNSGNSPFPHIHYHLQTTGIWLDGEGLPIQFHNVAINGKLVGAAEPVRGDFVEGK